MPSVACEGIVPCVIVGIARGLKTVKILFILVEHEAEITVTLLRDEEVY